MKKFFVLMVASILAFCFVGCKNESYLITNDTSEVVSVYMDERISLEPSKSIELHDVAVVEFRGEMVTITPDRDWFVSELFVFFVDN